MTEITGPSFSVRRARTADVPGILSLVEPLVHERILLGKERVDLYEAVQEFRVAETEAARARLAALSRDVVLHEELDRAMGELRADLNGALRPELAEIASGLLDVLTDGRYTHAEFGEDYQLTVVEDGLVKPVISGGEEDLCNLVLRLAISQMIAERSGTPFSLLILDEVFSALDEQRRANVLTLLRRLGDRFAQVVVITHNPGVRDALDNHVRVTLDLQTGESRVSYGEQTDGVIPFPSTKSMAEAA